MMAEKQTENDKLDQPMPLWFMLLIPVYALAFMSVLIFPFAGDWRWLEGWIFVITFVINITISTAIMNKKNPRVLRNRSKLRKEGLTDETRQAAASDRFVFPLMGIGFYGAIILPALGHRYGWYALPLVVNLGGAAVMNIGLGLLNIATLQNSYASKILDINKGQVLVDTGLYAYVRHPLYAGGILMAIFIPIALGSFWGLIPAIVAAAALVIRIEFEEEMLIKGMEGYEDYQTRVKYKLIPKVY
jgi:protein-S-isoprenylcysteine O-methyltransferase Ste14